MKPLIVNGPSQVLDRPRDGLELILEDVLLVDRVPDPDLTRLIRRCNVEPTGAVLGHINLTAMLGVHISNLGTGEVPDDDTVTMAVEEILPLGISTKHYWLTSLSAG